jgi:PAP2 superfamily
MPVPSSKLRFALADGWLRQVLLFVAAYLIYGASRWVLTGDEATALEHAHWIVELEATLGVAVEASVQQALEGTALLWLLDHAYLAAQLVVMPAALIWLYRRDKPAYRGLRDTVLATWLLALPVFWLLPVAPPRLAGLGIADTITQQTGLALDSKLTTSFYNPLAAVPSLHCGFALAVSLALAGSARRRWTCALTLAWAPTIFLAVVATGNHFVFDIAAGIAITLLGFGAARLAAGRREPARRCSARRPDARPALATGGGRGG